MRKYLKSLLLVMIWEFPHVGRKTVPSRTFSYPARNECDDHSGELPLNGDSGGDDSGVDNGDMLAANEMCNLTMRQHDRCWQI